MSKRVPTSLLVSVEVAIINRFTSGVSSEKRGKLEKQSRASEAAQTRSGTTTMSEASFEIEQSKKIAQVIAKCWAEEDFKRKLFAEPAATLTAEGVELPAGLSVTLTAEGVELPDGPSRGEYSKKVFHLVIPAKPTDIWDDDFDNPQAAWFANCPCSGSDCFDPQPCYVPPCRRPVL